MADSLDEMLAVATSKLNLESPAKRIFNDAGCEIDDLALIKDGDVITVTSGEDYTSKEEEAITTPAQSNWISLNVGGRIFTTTRSTLVMRDPESMLARMFSNDTQFCPSPSDSSGAFLIDRSPEYFAPILGWLRHGELIIDKHVNPRGILEEAKFYGLQCLVNELEAIVSNETPVDRDKAPLTRRDVVNAIIGTCCAPGNADIRLSQLRFQGLNLSGADLSKLDLRYINMKGANLRGVNFSGSNLSYSTLERADLTGSNLDDSILYGVKMVCANLNDCSLIGINCEDPTGARTNMEGVNLKSANLEGSQLAHVNLRVAKLKNAVLRNCNLRGACLAGADLEDCDLSGSDLQEANLRGANLKSATFKLMMTPLHMSQAIGR